jgi:competence protein ComEC
VVAAAFAAERDRWFLWLPVLVGAGIALYFALPAEPPGWLTPLAALAGLGTAIPAAHRARRRGVGTPLALALIALAAIALGAAAADWRAWQAERPRLEYRVGPLTVSGRVVRVEALPAGARVTLAELAIRALPPDSLPASVRLRFPDGAAGLAPGDRIRLKAVLNPVPAPTSPGAFDFQRLAYFQGLGAVGFAVGGWERLPAADPSRAAGGGGVGRDALEAIGRLRVAIADRIRGLEPGPAGEMMVALIIGEQTGLPPDAMAALRDAGLAHLLSISGVHIGMVGGFLFFWVRALAAAVPWLCLRLPAKKIAAMAAIAGAAFYVLLAEAPVPTQRAFFMLAIVMLAVIFDRRAVSMRLIAWAALIILLTQPESLTGASFQMSFAAMVALIALYETIEAYRRRADRTAGAGRGPAPLRRAGVYLASILASTVVATLATAPFAIHHFNRLAVFGAVANLVAIPLTGFVVMPAAVVAMLLMPLGLDAVPFQVMAWGTEQVLAIARWAAALPAAALQLPLLPVGGLALISLGGLWFCLWQRRWRRLGLVAVFLGLATMAWVRPPDIFVDGSGGLIAVRTGDGRLAVSSPRAAGFARRAWQQRLGEGDAEPLVWPVRGSLDAGRLACDPLGCVFTAAGRVVALPRRPAALIEDCRAADLVISGRPLAGLCGDGRLTIDASDLERRGGHAVWLTGGGIRIASVDAVRGRRPWVTRARPPDPAEDAD